MEAQNQHALTWQHLTTHCPTVSSASSFLLDASTPDQPFLLEATLFVLFHHKFLIFFLIFFFSRKNMKS